MNVFILCTGRTGSTTIIKACGYIENYTSSHESLSKKFGGDRFAYRGNHIEGDNRLSWHLGELYHRYGDAAFYVHLKRDRDQVAHSFMNRFNTPTSIIDAFCEGLRMRPVGKLSKEDRLQACYDYIDTVNTNIAHFVADKKHTMTINLENIDQDFPEFWKRINAKGDLELAMSEFSKNYNASNTKQKLNYRFRLKRALREYLGVL